MSRACCMSMNSSPAAALLYAPRRHPWHSGYLRAATRFVTSARSSTPAAAELLTTDAAAHFKTGAGSAVSDIHSPWAVGWQMRERNIQWNDELKLRLIKHMTSQELGLDDQELDSCLQTICVLLPDYSSRLANGSPQQIALLIRNTNLIATRLLRLREMLPQADISHLVSSRLSLLLEEDLNDIAAAIARLRELLPFKLVDKFVEAHPQVLDVQDFEQAVEDAKMMLDPHLDLTRTLRNTPHLILELQKGRHLIPYELPNV